MLGLLMSQFFGKFPSRCVFILVMMPKDKVAYYQLRESYYLRVVLFPILHYLFKTKLKQL